jgi:hypothetical protein
MEQVTPPGVSSSTESGQSDTVPTKPKRKKGPRLTYDESLPLTSARKRFDKAKFIAAKPDNITRTQEFVAGMSAAGISNINIARAVGLPGETAVSSRVLPIEETVLAVRERLKAHKIRAMERIESRLYPRIEREADTASAKDLDAMTRAAMNLEKIQQTASGEGTQVTVNQSAPNVDLKVLIANLLNEPE